MNSIRKVLILSIFAGLAVTTQAKVVDVIDDIRVNPTVINNYQAVTIEMDWSKKGFTIDVGDTFSVALPAQMQANNTSTDMLNQSAQKIGECDLIAQKITCTFTANNVIDGKIGFTRSFYDASVTVPDTVVPTFYTVDSKPPKQIDMKVSPKLVDPNEILVKAGIPQGGVNVGEKFEWYVRANCRADTVNNFNLSDKLVGAGHKMIADTISITEGTCDGSGFKWERDLVLKGVVNAGTLQDYVASWDASAGEIALTMNNTTNKAYEIIFFTEITANQPVWENEVTLTGDGINESRDVKLEKQNLVVTGDQEGAVAGIVFLDDNNDGVADPGEGIAGIDVVVTDSVGTVVTVTTDTDGNWSTPVLAGDVTVYVDENDPDMPADLVRTVGKNPITLDIPADDVGTTLDGYVNNNNNNNNNNPANIPAINGSGLLALLLMIITLGAVAARRKVS